MVEQAAVAGRALEELLPPARESFPGRDYRGEVMARPVPLTAAVADGLGSDYDLDSAEVRTVRVERAGTRLTGFVVLAAARRHPTSTPPEEPAELHLWLKDLSEVRFDSHDYRGITFRSRPGETLIDIGVHGALIAAVATIYPDDRDWHLSTAGREADARTPPRGEEPRRTPPLRRGELDGAARLAATILRRAMWEICSVRYATRADRVPIQVPCPWPATWPTRGG